jgi:hypothetical protein
MMEGMRYESDRQEAHRGKRTVQPEIWTLVALEVLQHGDKGSYRGVRFKVQLDELHHMERPLLVDTREAGYTAREVKELEETHLFYPQTSGERWFMQTSSSNLRLAVDWKVLRGCNGDPRKGGNAAYRSPEFVFNTLRVR